MMMIDQNALNSAGSKARHKRRDNGDDGVTNQSPRPFGDAGNLNEIPRPRPEDPPLRKWWVVDDESSEQR